MMNRIAIVGTAINCFTKDGRLPIESLLADASTSALGSAKNLDGSVLDTVMVSTNDHARYLGPILAESVGARPRAAQTIESMCSSGTNALVSGFAHISAGLADTVLVAGADSFDGPGRVLEWDKSRGSDKRPVMWASRFATAYKSKYNITDEQISTIAARAHANAKKNPDAYEHDAPTPDQVLDSKEVAPSVRLLECSRSCTGAAALVLASERTARQYTDTPVWITGIGQSTLGASLTSNVSLSELESARVASSSAFEMAGIGPSDIDVAEVHDAFTICEPMIAEAVGMAEQGRGAVKLNEMYETGEHKINPRGGIVGSGHPLGTTGVAQIAHVARQIAGTAGDMQLDTANTGLVHNMAAAATSSTVIVMKS